MDAMALIHSRVRRVFYGCDDAQAGVLRSRAMIHEESTINHKYEVYCGVLEKECRLLLLNPSDMVVEPALRASKKLRTG